MRLLFLFLVSCFLSLSLVFSQSLTLSSSSTELVAGKTFTLKLQADAIPSLEAVKIQGLEQFQML
jgi:hypothetical protein